MPKPFTSWFMLSRILCISSERRADSMAAKFCEPRTRRMFEEKIGVSRATAWSCVFCVW